MPDNDKLLPEMQRMSRLLGLVAVKGLEDKEQVLTLIRAGYTKAEVASILGKGESAVSMIVLRHKKQVEAEKAARKKAPKAAEPAAASNGNGDGK